MLESLRSSADGGMGQEIIQDMINRSLQPIVAKAFKGAFESSVIPAFQVITRHDSS